MAAAIILIPEMLSGPKRSERPAAAQTPADAPLKTYTIDLNRSPGASTTPVEERAPPPEEAPADPQPTETPPRSAAPQLSENPTPAPQAVPERTQPVEATASRQERLANEQQPVARPPAPEPQTQTPPLRAIASASAVPTSRGWAVQLGSFASRATADGMVKDLSQQGQSAFVMPVRSGNSTLYRVRIGPFAERAAANKALLEVKGRIANAAVVAHP